MEHNEVDVTHTVKVSESNGRRLIKNVDTGEIRWEDGKAEIFAGGPVKPPSKAELKKLEAQLKALTTQFQD